MMRQGWLMMALLLFPVAAQAITPAQLDQAREDIKTSLFLLNDMKDKLTKAEEGMSGTLTLTNGQKQQLQSEYNADKSSLQTLLQGLP